MSDTLSRELAEPIDQSSARLDQTGTRLPRKVFAHRKRKGACAASITKLALIFSMALWLPCDEGLTGEISNGEASDDKGSDTTQTVFTGEILPVFYVKDVIKSVLYYRDSLGFDFHSYHDYETGESVQTWTKDSPAIYAEMGAADLKFGLHRPRNPDSLVVGGMIHYFGVEDVRTHHKKLAELGVDVSEIFEMPWMTMFSVKDPDGHRLFFFHRRSENRTVHQYDLVRHLCLSDGSKKYNPVTHSLL